MNQEKIWNCFQNDERLRKTFPEARSRFMLQYLDSGMSVLNIGVGDGALERFGIDKGVTMHSLDPNERVIVRLRHELGMGTRARVGYSQSIPFSDERFDAVVMCEVMEHLEDDILKASVAEVARVLKSSGFLLASTPYREDLISGYVACPQCGAVFHRWGHVQSFDKEDMRKLLEENDLKVRKIFITTFVDWNRKGSWNFMKSLARLFLARLKISIADPHLIIIAEKNR